MEKINIKNCPKEAFNYEFIVVSNNLEYIAHTTNGFEAENFAKQADGFIIHNVRIQGKRKEK